MLLAIILALELSLGTSLAALAHPLGNFTVNCFKASLNGAGEHPIHYVDNNYADHLGWQEVIVAAQAGAAVTDASVPAQNRSHGLTIYPHDLLSDPLLAITFGVLR